MMLNLKRRPDTKDVISLLRRIRYPGYDADIVSLGVVEEVSLPEPNSVAISLRHGGTSDERINRVVDEIKTLCAKTLKVSKVEVAIHRLEPELGERTGQVALEGVRHVIAVASGKGGVGKSTVAANLAVALRRLNYEVGLLDADIYGPSVPMMFGLTQARLKAGQDSRLRAVEQHGVSLMSIGFFLTERAPVIWRGPLVMSAVRQFLKDTIWGEKDFLIVDLPPGTGDAQLTLAQQVCLDGAIVVTTPQDVALLDARRALRMLKQVHCPILGVVENMSYFVCPECGAVDELFGHGGGERMAQSENLKLLARLPIYSEIRETGDQGTPIAALLPDHPAAQAFLQLARDVAQQVLEVGELSNKP